MLSVKVDKRDATDLYLQVAGEIRRAIAEGEAKPGERLPPAKDLAAILDVNTNTVLRSLRVLRDEGLLEFRRGRGISVAGTPERGAVVQRARELVAFARSQGYRLDELVEIIERRRLTNPSAQATFPHTRARGFSPDPWGAKDACSGGAERSALRRTGPQRTPRAQSRARSRTREIRHQSFTPSPLDPLRSLLSAGVAMS